MGFSGHSVPSLSNTAMRSATGTTSGEPGVVTFVTYSMIALFALPSFHEGRGSAARAPPAESATSRNTAN